MEQLIQKSQNEIEMIEAHLSHKQLESLRQSLEQEKEKLTKLLDAGQA